MTFILRIIIMFKELCITLASYKLEIWILLCDHGKKLNLGNTKFKKSKLKKTIYFNTVLYYDIKY